MEYILLTKVGSTEKLNEINLIPAIQKLQWSTQWSTPTFKKSSTALKAGEMGRERKGQECLQSSKKRQKASCKGPTIYSLRYFSHFFLRMSIKNRELLSSQCLESCPCKQRDPETWIRELFITRSINIPRFQFGVRSALWKLKTNDLKRYPCMLSRAKGVHRYQCLAEQIFFSFKLGGWQEKYASVGGAFQKRLRKG